MTEMQDLMSYLGWMSRVRLTEQEAKQANEERDLLLGSLADRRIHHAFKQSKIYYGNLSPGCLTCGQGTWSCLFVNGLCTADCFFCPQDRSMTKERSPAAEEIVFDDTDTYLDYLHQLGFKGVGFSGGETLLVFEKLLCFIKAIKQSFGCGMYVWIYTNGDLVDKEKLACLQGAGLDEIRFNISARGYGLDAVELARSYIPVVSVEIPAIPEDYATLEKCILAMNRIGVNYLNVHQLVATKHNYTNLTNREYTFLPSMAFHESPVFESEIAALKLIQCASDNDLDLSMNYCSHAYKARFQKLARRRRGAILAKSDLERVTEAGYLRRLSVRGPFADIEQIVRCLRESGTQENLWSLDETGTELSFHPSLLKRLGPTGQNLTVCYSEAHFVSQQSLRARKLDVVKVIKLAPDREVLVGRRQVTQQELCLADMERYEQLFDERIKIDDTPGDRASRTSEQMIHLEPWERIEVGFQGIFPTVRGAGCRQAASPSANTPSTLSS